MANTTESKAAAPAPSEPMAINTGRARRLFRAGIFSVVGFALLVAAVFIIGGKTNLFEATLPVYTTFPDVQGLQGGAMVMLNGIKVGSVASVKLMLSDSSYVRVDMVIDEDYRQFITKATVATVGQEGLVGNKLINLVLRKTGAPRIPPGGYIEGIPPVDYFAVVEQATDMVRSARSVTETVDTLLKMLTHGKGTLGKFLTDETAYDNFVTITQTAEHLFNTTGTQIEDMSNQLQRSAATVNAITEEAQKLIADVGRGKGTVGALLYDRSLYDSLEVLAGALNQAVGNAGFAAQEFGINMRGLRNHWLLGPLFGGGEQVENVQLQQKMLEIRMAEIDREKKLLEQREREVLKDEHK